MVSIFQRAVSSYSFQPRHFEAIFAAIVWYTHTLESRSRGSYFLIFLNLWLRKESLSLAESDVKGAPPPHEAV